MNPKPKFYWIKNKGDLIECLLELEGFQKKKKMKNS